LLPKWKPSTRRKNVDVISTIHRYLGETLLLVALIGVILALVALARRREMERAERVFGIIYAGLLDLQALLGGGTPRSETSAGDKLMFRLHKRGA